MLSGAFCNPNKAMDIFSSTAFLILYGEPTDEAGDIAESYVISRLQPEELLKKPYGIFQLISSLSYIPELEKQKITTDSITTCLHIIKNFAVTDPEYKQTRSYFDKYRCQNIERKELYVDPLTKKAQYFIEIDSAKACIDLFIRLAKSGSEHFESIMKHIYQTKSYPEDVCAGLGYFYSKLRRARERDAQLSCMREMISAFESPDKKWAEFRVATEWFSRSMEEMRAKELLPELKYFHEKYKQKDSNESEQNRYHISFICESLINRLQSLNESESRDATE